MARIRTAHADIRETSEGAVAVGVENDDGGDRRIIGASISGQVTGSGDNGGMLAVWSTQTGTQGDLNLSSGVHAETPDNARKNVNRSPVFHQLRLAETDDGETSNTDFGSPDAWIPWPDGSEMHLNANMVSDGADDGLYTTTGILYYLEEEDFGGTL